MRRGRSIVTNGTGMASFQPAQLELMAPGTVGVLQPSDRVRRSVAVKKLSLYDSDVFPIRLGCHPYAAWMSFLSSFATRISPLYDSGVLPIRLGRTRIGGFRPGRDCPTWRPSRGPSPGIVRVREERPSPGRETRLIE